VVGGGGIGRRRKRGGGEKVVAIVNCFPDLECHGHGFIWGEEIK